MDLPANLRKRSPFSFEQSPADWILRGARSAKIRVHEPTVSFRVQNRPTAMRLVSVVGIRRVKAWKQASQNTGVDIYSSRVRLEATD